jgi:hypothetical protein
MFLLCSNTLRVLDKTRRPLSSSVVVADGARSSVSNIKLSRSIARAKSVVRGGRPALSSFNTVYTAWPLCAASVRFCSSRSRLSCSLVAAVVAVAVVAGGLLTTRAPCCDILFFFFFF